MIVIGVTGFRRSGKTTVTSILKQYGFVHYGFADALRGMATAINPTISLEDAPPEVVSRLREELALRVSGYRYADLVRILGYELAKEIPDLRLYLQRLGTEGVRGTFGPQAWVNALDHRIQTDKPDRVAISDVRFQSEADWVRKQGGVLWRTVRPGNGGNDLHASEVEMQQIVVDHIVIASSLEELERAVIDAVKQTLPTLLTHTQANHASDRPSVQSSLQAPLAR